MPEKIYRIILDEDNYIFVFVEIMHGDVTAFVVKYITIINGVEYEVLRYDSGHGIPHIDILDDAGKILRKVWLPHLDFAKALTQAKEDIRLNYKLYRERFLKWKREE